MTRDSSRLAAASHRKGFVPQLPSGHFRNPQVQILLARRRLRCSALDDLGRSPPYATQRKKSQEHIHMRENNERDRDIV
jgi:hypothetical protein